MNKNWKIGQDSAVNIENTEGKYLEKIFINIGRNCIVHVMGISVVNTRLEIFMNDNCSLIIYPNQQLNGNVRILMHEPSRVSIGEGCLWASTNIWTSDMHSIIDLNSGARLNPASDIYIGNKVWLGENSLILKGSKISDGSVIAANTVITKSTNIPPNCLIAGNPAKILRSNISWKTELL